MGQSYEETQVYEEDYLSDEEPKEGKITITTGDFFQKTGEVPEKYLYYTAWFEAGVNIGIPNISDLYDTVHLLKTEINNLKIEYNKINHRINEIIPKQDYTEIKTLPDNQIEKLILKHLKKNKDKTIYPSDIAFKYKLDARTVFDISQKLKKEGNIN